MRTGIVNSAYYSEKCGGVDYRTMRAHGYSCADYQYLADTKNSVFYHVDENAFAKMLTEERMRAEDAGIAFSQVHAPWPTDDLTPESRAVKPEYMKKAVRGCAHLHGGYLVVHPICNTIIFS